MPEVYVPVVLSGCCLPYFVCESLSYWRTKNGSKRFISWSNTVTVDGDGLVEYVIASGIDITDRTEAEKWFQTARDQGFSHTPISSEYVNQASIA